MAMSVLEAPGSVVDAEAYVNFPASDAAYRAAAQVATAFERDGFLVIRIPGIDFDLCKRFFDKIEEFARLPEETQLKCWRPDRYHQIGLTPKGKEVPGSMSEAKRDPLIDRIAADQKPHPVIGADLKSRLMINIGRRPTEPRGLFPALDDPEQVVPEGIADWLETCVPWGEQLRDAGMLMLEMAAVGWGCEDPKLLSSVIEHGYNLLAPTISEFTDPSVGPDTVFAGVHKDSSLLTVHPKASHAGLDVWTRDLNKVEVRVPEDCLLAQGGRILEWLTGGRALRGLHQVVNRPQYMPMIEQARAEGRQIFRIASPIFLRPATDYQVRPLGPFATAVAMERYRPFVSGQRLMEGLERRGLGAD